MAGIIVYRLPAKVIKFAPSQNQAFYEEHKLYHIFQYSILNILFCQLLYFHQGLACPPLRIEKPGDLPGGFSPAFAFLYCRADPGAHMAKPAEQRPGVDRLILARGNDLPCNDPRAG